jgi:hypothetical protein
MTNPSQPAQDCPVATINDEMMQLIAIYSDESKANALAAECAYQKMEGLAKYATHLRTKSIKGALLQIGLLRSNLEMLQNLVEALSNDSKAEALAQVEAQELYDSSDRMLWSLVQCLEFMGDERIENACGNMFMNRRLNPHKILDEALSA